MSQRKKFIIPGLGSRLFGLKKKWKLIKKNLLLNLHSVWATLTYLLFPCLSNQSQNPVCYENRIKKSRI